MVNRVKIVVLASKWKRKQESRELYVNGSIILK